MVYKGVGSDSLETSKRTKDTCAGCYFFDAEISCIEEASQPFVNEVFAATGGSCARVIAIKKQG